MVFMFSKQKPMVVHRINEYSKRKSMTGVNHDFMKANQCADYMIIVVSWLTGVEFDQASCLRPSYTTGRSAISGACINELEETQN